MQRFRDNILIMGSNGLIPYSGSSVAVYLAGTSTLASIYPINDPASAKENPFRAGDYGEIDFYAQNGRYDLLLTRQGYQSLRITDLQIWDPADSDFVTGVDVDGMIAGKADITYVDQKVSGLIDDVTPAEDKTYSSQKVSTDLSAKVNVFDLENATDPDKGAAMVGFKQNGAGAADRTLADKAKERVTPEDFGAVGDGLADDTAAMQRALNAADVVVLNPMKRYLIDSDHLHIPHRKALIGLYEHRSTTGKDWSIFGSAIVLNPSYSVIVKNGSQLKGCVVIRKGIVGVVSDGEASFDGYGVIADEGDGYIGHNAIIGFEYGVYNGPLSRNGFVTTSRARPRVIVEDNAIDCINGIVLGTASDPDKIRRNHLWPYTSPTVGDNHLRSGVGIKLYERHDHTQMRDNVVYGYQTGYLFENTQNVVSINDFYDTVRTGLLSQPKTSIGMMITGTPGIEFTHVQLTLICPQISAAGKGIYQNAPNGQFTVIESPAIFAQETHAIEVVGGDMDIHGGFLTNTVPASNGLVVNNAASQVRHTGLRFVNYPTEASRIVKLAGVVRASLAREIFAETVGDDTVQFLRSSGASGASRLVLDNEGNTNAAQLTHFNSSNTVALSIGGVEAFRASTTGTGIGTGLPRARFHSLGASIVGLGTAEIADTALDDNAGPQVNIWLDVAANKLRFKVIYPGDAGDTGRILKSGEILLE